MTYNINTNKNQRSDAIENESKFDNTLNVSRGTKDPLPVVTVSPRPVKKKRAMNVAGLTLLCYIGATNSIIKIKHTE